MNKQWILLLVLAIVLTSAPAAMAAHCERCRPVSQSCGSAFNYGWEYCEWDVFTNSCYVEFACGPHSAATTTGPLANEFTVASVERLDEPQPAETRIASLEAPAPVTNR